MTADQITFELVKLALQAGGATLVAFLAVGWARQRYKHEKTWERQLAAYVDVCTALGEMILIVSRWADELEGGPRYNDDFKIKMGERYSEAKRKVENAVAVSALILPPKTSAVLGTLASDIESVDFDDPFDRYYHELGLIDDALAEITRQGRDVLGFPALTDPVPRWRKRSTPSE